MISDFKITPLIPGKSPSQTLVVVAMSGGVDSSVVAALLRYYNYKVVGVTLRLYNGNPSTKKGACCGSADLQDAKQVARIMGFPHHTLNYEEIFKQEVINDFTESYLRGETPIPCVRCNQTVKFRDLLKVARNLGADVLATGHYVRRVEKEGEIKLYPGKDPGKDQTYFLFAITPEQLNFLRFPLGDFYKKDVRNLAKFFNLKIAEKADSQDICFVSSTYQDVITRTKPQAVQTGNIIHINGQILGKHSGIINFTIGQRRGIGIAYSEPLYVVKLDAETNQVIVGPASSLLQKTVNIKELNWLANQPIPPEGLSVDVKLRSAHAGSSAIILPMNAQGISRIILQDEHFAIAPGQACVVYKEQRMLGGGWIC